MNKRIILTLALVFLLTLSFAACSPSKVERVQVALEAATLIPGAEKPCVAEGLNRVRGSLAIMKSSPTPANWRLVKDAALAFNVAACTDNARLIAIVAVIGRIVQSVDPQPTLSDDSRVTAEDYRNALRHVDEADLKELERLVKGK